MRCSKAREWLSLALDDQLAPDRTQSLDEHLQRCSGCLEYKKDMELGQRLLRATEPGMAENFEWRLQLKLNQTLKDAAQHSALPWEDSARPAWNGWWRNFGLSTLAGAAVVIALAFLIQPDPDSADKLGSGLAGGPTGGTTGLRSPSVAVSRRADLPLTMSRQSRGVFDRGATGLQVSGGRRTPSGLFENRPRVYTDADLALMSKLQRENQWLRERLHYTQVRLKLIEAQLDSAEEGTLDLEGEQIEGR